MTRKCLVCLALCFIGGTTGAWAVSSRAGDVIHCRSKTHRFYLTVPGEWRKVSQLKMDELRINLDPGSSGFNIDCVAAYGRDFAVGDPALLIIVTAGYFEDGRQISRREIRRAVKTLTGADLETIRRATPNREDSRYITQFETKRAEYYEDRKLLLWDAEIELEGSIRLEQRHLCFFGRKTWVMVVGRATAGQFAECGKGLDCIVHSFNFEPGAEFEETEWYKSHWFAIGLIAVATSLLAYIFRERKH